MSKFTACSRCDFWVPDAMFNERFKDGEQRWGRCHRYPPRPVIAHPLTTDRPSASGFVHSRRDEWCGEFVHCGEFLHAPDADDGPA